AEREQLRVRRDGRLLDRTSGGRHLTERKIFVEAFRGEFFNGAREHRDECAAGRIGPTRAALEPCGNAGALKRMLEQSQILLRRPEEDGHLIELDAAPRLPQHTTRDLDRLASFA